MAALISEDFSRRQSDFFSGDTEREVWNVDRTVADFIRPTASQSGNTVVLELPSSQDGRLAVSGFVRAAPLMRFPGKLLIRAEFRPLQSGTGGEHFGIFCRVHNTETAARSRRIGLAVQNGSLPSGQCQGKSAFLQFTGRLKGSPPAEFGHDFYCFDLEENPFTRGLGRKYRLEFEELYEGGQLAWEGRVFRWTILGWSLRGERRIRQSDLQVEVPALPSKIGLGMGPGEKIRVEVSRFTAFEKEA